jgi:hypothetical protein
MFGQVDDLRRYCASGSVEAANHLVPRLARDSTRPGGWMAAITLIKLRKQFGLVATARHIPVAFEDGSERKVRHARAARCKGRKPHE